MVKRKAKPSDTSDRPKRPITTDPRFSGVHSDPRFAPPKKKDSKVVLDSRFKSKLSSDADFKQRRVVDKFGRKVEKNASEIELKRYYRMEDEDADEGHLTRPGYDPARGEGLIESSSEEDDTEEEVDDTEDVFESTIQEETIPRGDETATFAVVNLDWDHVRAENLMVAFSSFVPPGGRVISVNIYPSQFGKERMEQEEQEGPPRNIFSNSKTTENEGDEGDEDVNEKTIVKEDNGEEFDSSKLRKYQLQRLRYYYAVVKCDSVTTARKIYESCDGTEYEATSNFFDLRFVPDDMEFDDKPTDSCTKVPSKYRPAEFVTDALQHSKVKLTWDETPHERLQFARRAFSRREIEDMDFKAYLASSDSDSDGLEDENKDKLRDKYRSLLSESKDNTGFQEKGNVDMEITFQPGLSVGAEQDASEADEETTIEKYKRKESERRKQRMENNKTAKPAAGENETVKKGKKAKKTKAEAAEDERRKAELELLMMGEDEDNDLKHFDMRDIIKSEKQQKNKKLRKKPSAGHTADEFTIDVEDSRFSALYDHHEFAIDPSQPQFKETSAMKRLLDERRRRAKNEEPVG